VRITAPPQIASKVTEIGRISVVMYVLDQFIYGKLQLTDYRDPSSKVGVLGGEKLQTQEKQFKSATNRGKRSGAPWRMETELK